jgi:hypothetical protein
MPPPGTGVGPESCGPSDIREHDVIDRFCRWLQEESWQSKLEVAWVDVTATRGGRTRTSPTLPWRTVTGWSASSGRATSQP